MTGEDRGLADRLRADHDHRRAREIRRLQYTYSNGVVIYLNGRPLAFAMNPGGLRGNLGVMAKVGDAVYLPLKRGGTSSSSPSSSAPADGRSRGSARAAAPGGGA